MRYRPAFFSYELGWWNAILLFVYLVAAAGASIALVLYTDYADLVRYTDPPEFSSLVLPVAIQVVMFQVLLATVDFALARPLLARKRRKQQALALPLVASGDPALAERLDEHLDGFGER